MESMKMPMVTRGSFLLLVALLLSGCVERSDKAAESQIAFMERAKRDLEDQNAKLESLLTNFHRLANDSGQTVTVKVWGAWLPVPDGGRLWVSKGALE